MGRIRSVVAVVFLGRTGSIMYTRGDAAPAQRPLAELVLTSVSQVMHSLQWVALCRPDIVLQTVSQKPETISRGLLPSGVSVLVAQAKRWRKQWADTHNKSTSSYLQFLDIGSGDGGVLLSVSILTGHDGGPWGVAGIEVTEGIHASSMEWLTAIGRQCPAMIGAVVEIQRNMFCRDASNPKDPHVVKCLGEADVIFINNLCFDATIQAGNRTLNMKLIDSMLKFCTVKSAPTVVITTSELTSVGGRTPLVMHGNLLSQVGSFPVDATGYNWGTGQSLTMYMHTVTRAPAM